MSEIQPTVQEIDIVFGKLINLINKVYENGEQKTIALNHLADALNVLEFSKVQ